VAPLQDAHTAEVSIPGFPEGSFFAVFDGHGGKTVSLEAAVRLIPNILESKAFRSGSKVGQPKRKTASHAVS
jgi:protein phosphatase 1B